MSRGRIYWRYVPLALAVGLFAAHPAWLAAVEVGVFDAMTRRMSGSAGGGVVLVEIDDRSLATHGRWPWRRSQTAELVRALTAGRPAAVGLAMMFSEPGDGDEELAAAMAGGPVVSGYDIGTERTPPLPAELEWPADGRMADRGFLNAGPDEDGVLRRVPLLQAQGGRAHLSLGLAALRASRPAGVVALRQEAGGEWSLRWNEVTVRLDAHGFLLPRLRPRESFQRYRASAVLAGGLPAGALAGKIVLVGVTARGFGDERITALSPAYSGLAVHASVVDNLLEGGALAPAATGRVWEALVLLVAGAGAALVPVRWLALGGGGVLVLSLAAFAWEGVFVSPVLVLFVLTGNALLAAARAALEGEDRHTRTERDLKAANDFMLAALASLTTLRDVETGAHLARVQRALRLLCDSLQAAPQYRMRLRPETVELLVAVAPIHDIGKIGIPDGILQKMGRLTPEEMTLIREHVRYGRQVLEVAREKSGLRNEELFAMCQALVYSHHERWNGSGYPDGLCGEEIPLPARLLAVVDVYDALATRRVYKPALPHDVVVNEIAAGRGVLFDPDIVDAFLAQHEKFRQVYASDLERAAAMDA